MPSSTITDSVDVFLVCIPRPITSTEVYYEQNAPAILKGLTEDVKKKIKDATDKAVKVEIGGEPRIFGFAAAVRLPRSWPRCLRM